MAWPASDKRMVLVVDGGFGFLGAFVEVRCLGLCRGFHVDLGSVRAGWAAREGARET